MLKSQVQGEKVSLFWLLKILFKANSEIKKKSCEMQCLIFPFADVSEQLSVGIREHQPLHQLGLRL